MTRAIAAMLLAASPIAGSAAVVETTRDNVYALCTVRDVTVKDNRMVGTIYRSAVFSAPASYDADISMTPEKGGKASDAFQGWVAKEKGFRKDRMSLGKGDEHYCIEAPLTLEGKEKLVAMTRDWDNSKFPAVAMVATGWSPPRREWDVRFDSQLADYERLLGANRDAHRRYDEELKRIEEKRAKDGEAAKAALEKFGRERASYEAAVAESERQRQAYREEYKRVTGRYPDP